MKRHSCALAPLGAQVAASRQRSSVLSSTDSSVNLRMERAVESTSQTSLVGCGMSMVYSTRVQMSSAIGPSEPLACVVQSYCSR